MPTRITLSLDDEVADRLARRARDSGRSLDEVADEVLRRVLRLTEPPPPRIPPAVPPYRMKTYAMKPWPGLDFDDIGGLLERAEGGWHR